MDGISAIADAISSKPDYSLKMAKQNTRINTDQDFLRLINDISMLLVGARSSEIDDALDQSLRMVGEFFSASVVGLGTWSDSGEILDTLHVWGANPVSNYLAAIPPGEEAATEIRRKGSVVWNCLEDLKSLPQFQKHVRQVDVMAGSIWMYRHFGSHQEHLAIGRFDPTPWPEDTLKIQSAIGSVLYNALYRRRAEAEAEHAQRLEQAIAEIAATLVRVRAEDVDAEISNALGQLGEVADADLCVFLRCSDSDTSTYKVNFEWTVDEVDGPIFSGLNLADKYPWLVRQLKKKRPLRLSNSDEFALEATAEFELLKRFSIQSMHWQPFDAALGHCGYIGLAAVNRAPQWPDGILSQLSLLGNIIADAMDRQRTDTALEQALNEIRTLKDQLVAENKTLQQEVSILHGDHELIGNSHAIQATIYQAGQVATTDSTVLLLGETGTGKGLIASRIHRLSKRNHHPLITVNCAALPRSLIESELFGHEKGAFTGAVTQKLGRFELAQHGTIFLDEIGDLPTELQAKLLRVLQEHEFERLGSSTTRTVDVRVIAATNRDLEQLIAQGEFRADLYYRLSVFPIRAPALRDRRSDIPLLAWFFISELQHRLGKEFNEVSAQAMAALSAYDWPGNVRELKNIIERAMILSEPPILRIDDWFSGYSKSANISVLSLQRNGETIEEVERAHIEKVLAACDWRIRGKDGAAEHLGLKRTTLQSRMKKLGIVRPTI